MRPMCQNWERWLFYLVHGNQHRELRKVREQGTMFKTKEQNKSPETDFNEMEISDLPNGEFEITVIKMLT